MFGSLAVAAALALSPSQPGSLKLINVRTTFGELGPVRADTKFLPGDLYFLAFDIDGITINEEGKVSYSMSMVVENRAGTRIFPPIDPKEPGAAVKPTEREEYLLLGGNRLPARAFVLLDLNQEPGAYTCKVTVTDRSTKATTEIKHAFEVKPREFNLVSLFTTSDPAGQHPTPPAGHTGQNLFIHARLVGYTRDKNNKTDAVVEFKIIDDATKQPTLPRPIVVTVPKEIDKDAPVELSFPVPFNRAGSFVAEIVATDNKSGKKTPPMRLPIRVVDSAR